MITDAMVDAGLHVVNTTEKDGRAAVRELLEAAEDARELPSFSEIVSCIEGALHTIGSDWRVDDREMHTIASAVQRLYDPPYLIGWDDKTDEWTLTAPDGTVQRYPGTPAGYEQMTGEKC